MNTVLAMLFVLHCPDVTDDFLLTGTVENTGADTIVIEGAQAFVSNGYAMQWVDGFNEQFTPLLPGESLDFDFAYFWQVAEYPGYSAWLELQGSHTLRAEITWSDTFNTSSPMALRADLSGAAMNGLSGSVSVDSGPVPWWAASVAMFGLIAAQRRRSLKSRGPAHCGPAL